MAPFSDAMSDEEFESFDLASLDQHDSEERLLLESYVARGSPEAENEQINGDGDNSPRARRLKWTQIINCLYFLSVTICTSVVLGLEWGKHCDQPLFEWALFLLGFYVIGIILDLYITFSFKNGEADDEEQNLSVGYRIRKRLAFFLQRVLRLFWVFWFIMGMVWTFRSRTCKHTAHELYIFCLSLIIVHLSLVGLVFLCCCCSLVCMGVVYVINPAIFGPRRNTGATKKMIDSLETKVYEDGMIEDPQDAKCAICLTEYVEGDTLRFLPCTPKQHHYHASCVEEWLKINKSCPFCKKNIDEVAEEPTKEETKVEDVV